MCLQRNNLEDVSCFSGLLSPRPLSSFFWISSFIIAATIIAGVSTLFLVASAFESSASATSMISCFSNVRSMFFPSYQFLIFGFSDPPLCRSKSFSRCNQQTSAFERVYKVAFRLSQSQYWYNLREWPLSPHLSYDGEVLLQCCYSHSSNTFFLWHFLLNENFPIFSCSSIVSQTQPVGFIQPIFLYFRIKWAMGHIAS